jgi:hypothetical protein
MRSRSAAPRRWWAPLVVVAIYLAVTRAVAALTGSGFVPSIPTLLQEAAAGLVAALVIGPLASRLPVAARSRFGVLFLAAWVFLAASNTVEAALYLRSVLAAAVPVLGAVGAAGLALGLTVGYPPPAVTTTVRGAVGDLLATRDPWSWAWRAILLAAAWVPIYLLFAYLDGALYLSAHLAEAGSTPFTSPSDGVIAAAQLVRGALHVLVLFPIAALLGGRRPALALWLPLVVAVFNAWVPLLQPVPGFDGPTRIANLVEITADAAVFGVLAAVLLARGPRVRAAAELPDG